MWTVDMIIIFVEFKSAVGEMDGQRKWNSWTPNIFFLDIRPCREDLENQSIGGQVGMLTKCVVVFRAYVEGISA